MTSIIPLQQHPTYHRALTLIGADADYVDGTMVLRRRLPMLGQVALVSRAAEVPIDVLAQQARIVLINAETAEQAARLRAFGAVQIVTPRSIAELALTQSEADQRNLMHGKWRNRLVAAERANLCVDRRSFDPDGHGWLLQSDQDQQRRNGFRGWPPALTHAFASTNPTSTHVWTAYAQSKPIAAIMMLRHGAVATYHIGWSSDAGRNVHAHCALIWRASRWLAAQGHSLLDLGGIETQHAPGLARFKLGTGAVPRALGGTWVYTAPTGFLSRGVRRIAMRTPLAS